MAFELREIEAFLSPLDRDQHEQIRSILQGRSFQIWGLPSGAEPVLRKMQEGDSLMLLESEDFRYIGTVLSYLKTPLWDLSAHIWGEQRFPLIVLLDGTLIRYAWESFIADFGFAENYHMRGNTARLADERLANSRFGSDEAFVSFLKTLDR
jgi:hypothetical protein